jgi:hypothetical protein
MLSCHSDIFTEETSSHLRLQCLEVTLAPNLLLSVFPILANGTIFPGLMMQTWEWTWLLSLPALDSKHTTNPSAGSGVIPLKQNTLEDVNPLECYRSLYCYSYSIVLCYSYSSREIFKKNVDLSYSSLSHTLSIKSRSLTWLRRCCARWPLFNLISWHHSAFSPYFSYVDHL